MKIRSAMLTVCIAMVSSLITVFVFQKGEGGFFHWPKVSAQAGIRGVLLVIGSTCPAGFQEPSAAGFSDNWESRFPLFTANTAATTGPTSNGSIPLNSVPYAGNSTVTYGGSDVMSVNQMPSHNHYLPSWHNMQNSAGGGGWALGGGGYHPTGDQYVTSSGGNLPYYQPFVKLKPCIWVVN